MVGAGPVGIITALALAEYGQRVLLLESGGHGPGPAQGLAEAENLNPDNHHTPEITVARRLGGTSNLWGGRCLPLDPLDCEDRPWAGPPGGFKAWPIREADLAPSLRQPAPGSALAGRCFAKSWRGKSGSQPSISRRWSVGPMYGVPRPTPGGAGGTPRLDGSARDDGDRLHA